MLNVTEFLQSMESLTKLSQRNLLRGDQGRLATSILQRQAPDNLVVYEMHTSDHGNGHGGLLSEVKDERSGFKTWEDLFNFVGCDWDAAADQNLDESIQQRFCDSMIRVYAEDGTLLSKCRGYPPAWSIEMQVLENCIQFGHVN